MHIKSYSGPKVQIQPEELAAYDNGRWSCEEKHDGHFCEITTDDQGTIVSLIGRSGKTFTNSNVQEFTNLNIGIPNSVFVSELEAGTEASRRKNDALGHSRLIVFDVVRLLGQSTVDLPNSQRRALLELAFTKENKFVKLVKRITTGFKDFYETLMSEGAEGIVLKRNDARYLHGKTDNMIRCKKHRYVDYVVMSIAKSKGGSPNFQVGLFIEGKLQRVATIKNLPNDYIRRYLELDFGQDWMTEDLQVFVGKVVECKGAEVHDSGALRHGHLERVRDDKTVDECTLEAALNS